MNEDTLHLYPDKSTNVRHFLPWPARLVIGGLGVLSRVAPGLAARLAWRAWTSPRRPQRPEREQALLASAARFQVAHGLEGLAAWSWGEGPTVLLVHGWEGRGSQLAAVVPALVERGYRVVALDAPGHGDSSGRRATFASFLDGVGAVAREVGPLHAVVGHSMGGAVALYAVAHGLPVERLVLLAPADASQALERFMSLVGLGSGARGLMEARVLAHFGRPMEDLSGPGLAAGLGVELLVVHDEQDVYVPWGDGRRIAEAAGATLVRTSGLGHHRLLRDAAVVSGVVEFVSEGSVRSGRAVTTMRSSS